MRVAIHDAQGRIDRILTVPAGNVGANLQPGEDWVEVADSVLDNTHYIQNAQAVAMPVRPSSRHTFDYEAKQWLAPALDELKAAKKAEINAERDRREISGFPYLGKTFDSDQRSHSRITTAVQAAQAAMAVGQPFLIEWTCADNSTIELTGEQMVGVPVAFAMYGNALHQTARSLKTQVDAAQTAEEVASIVFPD